MTDRTHVSRNGARAVLPTLPHQERTPPRSLVPRSPASDVRDSGSYGSRIRLTSWLLRIGVAGTFLGHGLYAVAVRPSWIGYLMAVGLSPEAARQVMPLIGAVDLTVALLVLVRPARGVFLWATCWAFAAALIRPLSGEPFLEFVERAALWAAPLAYLCLNGFPRRFRDLFR